MIFHIIRASSKNSPFKDIIQEIIHSKLGDTCYITSGFYSESTKNGYCISSDKSSTGLSFITQQDKNLSFVLRGSFNKANNTNLQSFYNALINANYIVKRINTASHRHEKVFIYEKDKKPLVEIIGSSNMTSSAYGTQKTFNHEADLVIINSIKIEQIVSKIIAKNSNINGKDVAKVMRLEYSDDNSEDLTSQMIWIRDKLFK